MSKAEIENLAERYCDTTGLTKWDQENLAREERILKEIVPRTRTNGYLTKDDFYTICQWKSKRSLALCKNNEDGFVKEVTQVALRTPYERLRIGVLLPLQGVDWPRASAILHMIHEGEYPIVDERALRTVGFNKYYYSFSLWCGYTQFCRDRIHEYEIDKRTFDRAIFQFDVDDQQRRNAT